MMNNCLNAYPVRGVMQTANDNRIGSRNKNQPKSKKEIKTKRKRINSKDDTKRGSNVPNKDKVLAESKTTQFNIRIPSSTPLITPVKREKLFNALLNNAEDDRESMDSESRIASSVPSSILDLLENYTAVLTHDKDADLDDAPVRDLGGYKSKLGVELNFSNTMIRTCDGKTILELIKSLRKNANSIISKGDSKSMEEMNKLLNQLEVQITNAAYGGQPNVTECTFSENEIASLKRKLRIMSKAVDEKENKPETAQLDLQTMQCMNNSLHGQLKKVTDELGKSQEKFMKQDHYIAELQKNNAKVGEELAHKTFEIGNQQKTFTSELEEVKKEVALATERIEVMRQQLSGVETENSLLRTKLQQKDIEILHLNDLNKGLQSSVSRLLNDVEAPAIVKHQPSTSNNHATSHFLKKLEDVLDNPMLNRNSTGNRSLSSKSFTAYDFSKPFNPPKFDDSYGQWRNNGLPGLANTSMSFSLAGPLFSEDSTPSTINSTLRDMESETSFRSSSRASFTAQDESEFAQGLALLDADMQRLQHSLRDMTASGLR